MLRIAVAASGNGSNFENLVHQSRQKKMPSTNIICLITDKQNAYALDRAKQLDIPHFIIIPNHFSNKQQYEQAVVQTLQEQRIDLLVLAGYMRIIGDTLLNAYPHNIINIHPSYLPAHPGKQGILDAFHAGQLSSGVTVHYVNEKIDGGEIILQEKISFQPQETIADWENKIHALEYQLYPQAINAINPFL